MWLEFSVTPEPQRTWDKGIVRARSTAPQSRHRFIIKNFLLHASGLVSQLTWLNVFPL